jgi:HAE1 family hydrophobic/amphiphilic exporter-1
MIVLVVVLLGAISLTRLPIDLFPDFELPVAIVSTSYSGAGPQEIENLITRQIEGAVATVGNIDTVSSISSEGSSIVIAQFNFGVDMENAALEMREKVDMVKGFLPEDSDDPMVLKIDPNAMPIMQISLTSEGDLARLQKLAEDTFSQRFERLDGVASVSIGGGYTREIEIIANQNQLSGMGLSIGQLGQIIGASNLNYPGGSVNKGDQELSVRITGEYKTVEDIKQTPIILQSGDVISLGDIADVKLINRELSSISRTNGKESITISIQKQSGKNTVQVAERIHAELKKLESDYPGIGFQTTMDSSMFIVQAINTVAKNAIFGSLLAVLILYIFLKNLRTTTIIGISIPISLITSFILLYFNGITLNIMTLGGLAMAVGMLVDSAIVVLENIFRFRSEGLSKYDAAIKGASEVGMAITASTLTTIAVFLPIVFVEGFVGTIFKDFAMTVTLSLAASLAVSLTLVPMLSSKMLSVSEESGKKRRLGKVYKVFDDFYEKVENKYEDLLNKSIKNKGKTVIIAVILFALSIASIFVVGMEFLPVTDEGMVSVNVNLPLGASTDKINSVAMEVEELLKQVLEIESVATNIGSGDSMMGGIMSRSGASISIMLESLSERNRSTAEIAENIRNIVKDIPGAEISVNVTSNMGMIMTGDPVSISIKGPELDVLGDISEDVKTIVESVSGTREVSTSVSDSVPIVEVAVKKEIAAFYGMTTAQVATGVRGGSTGMTVTRFKEAGDEINVVIKPEGDVSESIDNFRQLELTTPLGTNIPLSLVADISVAKGPVSIRRDNQEREVTVSGQIIGRDLNSITSDIEIKLEEYDMPEGYSYYMGGEREEMLDAFNQLTQALILAVILIYMVMAAQFESLIYPFIIMFTIPLAFSGGALGLFLTGRSLGVTALIGAIILAGIVVNNGIVLVDYINVLRKEGKTREEAILLAGPVRLRPILMTTLTTVLGLVPITMGIGEGAELMAPMGSVVIAGLSLSTVITLVLIPVIYIIFDDIAKKMKPASE